MKQTIKPGTFFAIIGTVLVVFIVAVVWYVRRPAASVDTSPPPTGQNGAEPAPINAQARSHPDETKEQRRARIIEEHRPMRHNRDDR